MGVEPTCRVKRGNDGFEDRGDHPAPPTSTERIVNIVRCHYNMKMNPVNKILTLFRSVLESHSLYSKCLFQGFLLGTILLVGSLLGRACPRAGRLTGSFADYPRRPAPSPLDPPDAGSRLPAG